jgi:hypothetical protein
MDTQTPFCVPPRDFASIHLVYGDVLDRREKMDGVGRYGLMWGGVLWCDVAKCCISAVECTWVEVGLDTPRIKTPKSHQPKIKIFGIKKSVYVIYALLI